MCDRVVPIRKLLSFWSLPCWGLVHTFGRRLVVRGQGVKSGKLNKALFPYQGAEIPVTTRISNVIVFMVGGTTMEEACKVSIFNTVPGNPQVVLGGTSVRVSQQIKGRPIVAVPGLFLHHQT